jgi:hypothetical protein
MAKQLGATDCDDPKSIDKPIQQHIAGSMTTRRVSGASIKRLTVPEMLK